MSKLTFYMTLFCAALLFSTGNAPASPMPGDEAPHSRLQRIERVSSPTGEAAKMAFVRSLSQENGKQPAGSPGRPTSNKRPREGCTSDGPMTTCCAPCGCCTWTGDGNGPSCKSWC